MYFGQSVPRRRKRKFEVLYFLKASIASSTCRRNPDQSSGGNSAAFVVSLAEVERGQARIDQLARDLGGSAAWVLCREAGEREQSAIVVETFSQVFEPDPTG